MVEIACHCNHGISGVEKLPSHSHMPAPGDHYVPGRPIEYGPFKGRPIPTLERDPEHEIRFWVDWKAVSRA